MFSVGRLISKRMRPVQLSSGPCRDLIMPYRYNRVTTGEVSAQHIHLQDYI